MKTDKGSLRNDANVIAISGVEGDYDDERMTVGEAVERLEKAGVSALVYTSPSHTEDTPRWRVLCPTSTELPPDRREHLVGRVNGVLGGVFSGESFTLSQSFYFGSVNRSPSHRAEIVEGQPIDLCDELDGGWIGRPASKAGGTDANGKPRQGKADTAELLAEIVSGSNFHAACVRLLGVWATGGVPLMDARARLEAAFDAVAEELRDARWQRRRDDIDRCLQDIYGRQGEKQDRGEAGPRTRRGPEPQPSRDPADWPDPLDFIGDAEVTGVPELKPDHLPPALSGFVFDTGKRMGVDPAAVALAALVCCAAVVNEEWTIQPKIFDYTWREQARLSAALQRRQIHNRPRHPRKLHMQQLERVSARRHPAGSDPAHCEGRRRRRPASTVHVHRSRPARARHRCGTLARGACTL